MRRTTDICMQPRNRRTQHSKYVRTQSRHESDTGACLAIKLDAKGVATSKSVVTSLLFYYKQFRQVYLIAQTWKGKLYTCTSGNIVLKYINCNLCREEKKINACPDI